MIQVVWDVTDQETRERETKALRKAEKELGPQEKLSIMPSLFVIFPCRKLGETLK